MTLVLTLVSCPALQKKYCLWSLGGSEKDVWPAGRSDRSETCRCELDDGKGSRRDFVVACPTGLAVSLGLYFSWRSAGFALMFGFSFEFDTPTWVVPVQCVLCSVAPASVMCPRQRTAGVTPEVFLAFRQALAVGDVDSVWSLWNGAAVPL